jgi:hypothetical protein
MPHDFPPAGRDFEENIAPSLATLRKQGDSRGAGTIAASAEPPKTYDLVKNDCSFAKIMTTFIRTERKQNRTSGRFSSIFML